MMCPLCPATVSATSPGTSSKPIAARDRMRSTTGAMPDPSTRAQRRAGAVRPPVALRTVSQNAVYAADMAASLAGVRQLGGDLARGRLQAVQLAARRLGDQLRALL